MYLYMKFTGDPVRSTNMAVVSSGELASVSGNGQGFTMATEVFWPIIYWLPSCD